MTTYYVGQKIDASMFPVIDDIYRVETTAEKKWFIIQSRAASEGRVVKSLVDRMNCAGYCPQEKIWGKRDRNNRPTKVDRKLWPGYVFAQIPCEGAFEAVRACEGVMRLVDRDGQHATVPDAWIADMQSREATGVFDRTRRRKDRRIRTDLGPLPEWMDVGVMVWISDGPFQSFVGKIAEANRSGRIRVSTELFGRETSVELEVDQVGQLC